jgi:methylmalonyl-CoA mutase C-terminal domain/subunit
MGATAETSSGVPYRILLGKPGLDGHDRGVQVLVRALRDAGFEVIYTGIRRTPEQIVQAAVEEDVDGVGVSSLSGAHMALFPLIAEGLRAEGMEDVLLFCGGIIPEEDRPALEACGYRGVFGPGSSTAEIIAWLRDELKKRSSRRRRL